MTYIPYGPELIPSASQDLTNGAWTPTLCNQIDADTLETTGTSGHLYHSNITVVPNKRYQYSEAIAFGTIIGPRMAIRDQTNSAFIAVEIPILDGVTTYIDFVAPAGCVAVRIYAIRLCSGIGTIDITNLTLRRAKIVGRAKWLTTYHARRGR